MWTDFNDAWLALFQKQKHMTTSSRRLSSSQSVMSQDALEKTGRELVQLCDGVERIGLVDYEHGVSEESIMAGKLRTLVPGCGGSETTGGNRNALTLGLPVLVECLNVYDPAGGSGRSLTSPSSTRG